MLLKIYYLISTLFIPFYSIYINRRIKLKKEDQGRFNERFGKPSVERKSGDLIWIHAASVGECLSALPVINEIEKITSVKQILLTSGTTSSALILKGKLSSKTIHQYLPLDVPLFNSRFLKYWKPKSAIFIESEIWPNLINQIKKMGIMLAVINGRMTLKSYNKWLRFKKTSKLIFNNYDLCLTQNKESALFYKRLGINQTFYTGNIKFSSNKLQVNEENYNNLKNTVIGRKVFLAASTHPGEEMIISNLTQKIRHTNREFLCILVPRHPNRSNLTKEILNCKFATRSKNETINDDTDIYLADTFGELGLFYKLADITFIGGSLVPHGGQNPIEAAYFCNNIFHGKHIENFLEVYETLNHLHITELVDNPRQLQVKIMKCYNDLPANEEELKRKIDIESADIIRDTMQHLNTSILVNDL